jgi:predicted O-methyltransferase YrrM
MPDWQKKKAMPDFLEILERHLYYYGEADSLPFGVRPRRKNQHGRTLLARVMRDMDFREGVEVGCERGTSAMLWCQTNPMLHLTCVDPYTVYRARQSQEKQDAVYELARENFRPFKITLLRESSLAAVKRFEDGSLDFVHIDGNHEFDDCMMDIIHWVPKVRDGGLVLIHDCCSFYRGGVEQAVNAYVSGHAIRSWFVTHDAPPTAFWMKGTELI